MKLTYTELLQLVEEHMAKKLVVVETLKADVADLKARVAALEAAPPPADFQTQIDALKASLAETDAALGAEPV